MAIDSVMITISSKDSQKDQVKQVLLLKKLALS